MARACSFAKLQEAPKFAVRHRNRCKVCGRARAYYRKFELCRVCLRNLALKGELPGVTKASW
ncbi:MAG: type Z 30S ribosomal protein S14 [Deltaproteobacteria bacterium]|nr:type Z 30S ribosomal protein S14 [Deltaproteobacteria bacterium]MDO9020309.1 type Z 30S ribosomal protein S14 [Myxococcales bacterium]TAK23660.1 MAG: type Z 30S ribosomal protein S14 [Myxococcaceae bacterium]MBK7065137.1 type Z 30S ribosomal protein S14 [Deltaproteobacteria bacterium]MBK8693107.1 type Z 30S ribosomal protein S14 [Deltaproteobacteria bacterium]